MLTKSWEKKKPKKHKIVFVKLEFRCNPKKVLLVSDDPFKGIANDDDDDGALAELELNFNQLFENPESAPDDGQMSM